MCVLHAPMPPVPPFKATAATYESHLQTVLSLNRSEGGSSSGECIMKGKGAEGLEGRAKEQEQSKVREKYRDSHYRIKKMPFPSTSKVCVVCSSGRYRKIVLGIKCLTHLC